MSAGEVVRIPRVTVTIGDGLFEDEHRGLGSIYYMSTYPDT